MKKIPNHLLAYVEHDALSGAWLKHPLLFCPVNFQSPSTLEDLFEAKKSMRDEAKKRRDWSRYLMAYEKPYRLQELVNLLEDELSDAFTNEMTAKKFWKLAEHNWVGSDLPENDPSWSLVMNSGVPHRHYFTPDSDKKAFKSLPDRVLVYKGITALNKEEAYSKAIIGWSWTTRVDVAEFFANRFKGFSMQGFIVATRICKEKIIGFTNSRNESEVVIDPNDVKFFCISENKKAPD